MSVNILSAAVRKNSGKEYAKALRRDGKIPGIFYIQGESPVSLTLEAKDVATLLASKPALISLELDEGKTREAVIREVQRNPITNTVTHLDLMGIKRGVKITVTVPVHLEGTPIGIKFGGIIETISRELDIECFPKDIPDSLVVDISNMDIGDSMHVSDLDFENIKILNRDDVPIVNVILPKVVVVEEEVEEEELEEGVEAPEEAAGEAEESKDKESPESK
jgi:large subunit ribosomal protein L25